MIRVPEKLRWRIVALVGRMPGQCWADLVPWALYGPEPERRLPWAPTVARCREDANRVGSCYCNKIQPEPWAAAVHDAHQHAGWDAPASIDSTVRCSCGWQGDNYRDHLANAIAAARPGGAPDA